MTPQSLDLRLSTINGKLSVISVAATALSALIIAATIFVPASQATVPADNSSGISNRKRVERVSPDKARSLVSARSIFRSRNFKPVTEVNEAGRYSLRGIANRRDGLRAFIHDSKTQKTITVGKGATLGSIFEVLDISEDGVTLRRGAEEFLLKKN